MTPLRQAWDVPARPRRIVIIGSGAIVRTAHLPAYGRLNLPVAGLFDVRREVAVETARRSGVRVVFDTLEEACAAGTDDPVVFDVAVPGDQIVSVLPYLPVGSAVLIQKPLGRDLAQARAIVGLCRERRLTAAMNFQLRFSPNMIALGDAIARGLLGDIVDVEVRVQTAQPWSTWDFLRGEPRLEVLYHSIHYLDIVRWLLGRPAGVYCRAVRHVQLPEFADTRSTIILDYGERIRCSLVLNHTHAFGSRHRVSMFKVEGTSGAAVLSLGVNLEYPSGAPDTLEIAAGGEWTPVRLRGSWFTEAFEGPMSNLQRFVAGEDAALVSPVEDALETMALVEACYLSSAGGGTPVPDA